MGRSERAGWTQEAPKGRARWRAAEPVPTEKRAMVPGRREAR